MNCNAPTPSAGAGSIVKNFGAMPGPLKLMTAHALICFVGLLVAVIPRDSFEVDSKTVTYAQWWASGTAPMIAGLSLIMTAAGILFLLRRGIGRYFYLGTFAGALIGVRVYQGNFAAAAIGAVFVAGLGLYLFGNARSRSYFARSFG